MPGEMMDAADGGFFQGRLAFIDSWRVFAVGLVIIDHLMLYNARFAGLMTSHHLGFASDYGTTGVFIYFFISGLVVSKTCLEEKARDGDFSVKGFYIRRIYRIVPPLLFYLAGCSFLSALGLIDFSRGDFFRSAAYLCNTTLVNCGWYVIHTWSLAFEEQFYLCFPILFCMIELHRPRWLAAIIVIPIALLPFMFSTTSWIGKTGFVTIYGLFSAGYLAARYQRFLPALLNSRWVAPLGLAAAVIAFFPISYFPNFFVQKFFQFLYVPAIPLLVLATGANGILRRFLSLSWLSYVGRATYSIYLWQEFSPGRYSHD